jgi:hypothetical protein
MVEIQRRLTSRRRMVEIKRRNNFKNPLSGGGFTRGPAGPRVLPFCSLLNKFFLPCTATFGKFHQSYAENLHPNHQPQERSISSLHILPTARLQAPPPFKIKLDSLIPSLCHQTRQQYCPHSYDHSLLEV